MRCSSFLRILSLFLWSIQFFIPGLRQHENVLSLAVKKKLRNRMVQQKFDYFLVVDFEATCEENKKIQPVQVS